MKSWAAVLRDRRARWLAENGPCQRCGSTADLHVDHIDPTQKVSHRIWSYSDEKRAAELAKCQVLCRSCHEKKTAGERCRLSAEQIADLKTRREQGETFRALAARFGISRGAAFRYAHGLRGTAPAPSFAAGGGV